MYSSKHFVTYNTMYRVRQSVVCVIVPLILLINKSKKWQVCFCQCLALMARGGKMVYH